MDDRVRKRSADLRAPAMRAGRFPFVRHEVSSGVAGNLGGSAAANERCLVASTFTTFFFLVRGLVEDSWESVA
jgi:hypothetical protein